MPISPKVVQADNYLYKHYNSNIKSENLLFELTSAVS